MAGKKRKKEIQYILISMLNSSIVTKSYEYEMAFYDNRFYLDENPICLYFKLKFLFDFFEEAEIPGSGGAGGLTFRVDSVYFWQTS